MVYEANALPTLVAAGYINIDMTAYVPSLPAKDERITGARVERALGGMSANLACAAARLGPPWAVRVELISTVGFDADSEWAVGELRQKGVHTGWLARQPDGRITYCLILVEPGGHRAIVSEPMEFHNEQVASRIEQPSAASAPRLLHTEGYRIPVILPLVEKARSLGWRTSVDLDGLPGGWLAPGGIATLARTFDVIFMNRSTARHVWPGVPEGPSWQSGIGGKILDLAGRSAVLLTLGEDGVLVLRGGAEPVHVPGTRVATVDTTGAGDTFAGAFLAAWLNGSPPDEAAGYASVAAALSTTAAGAQGYLPTATEVLSFTRKDSGKDAAAGTGQAGEPTGGGPRI